MFTSTFSYPVGLTGIPFTRHWNSPVSAKARARPVLAHKTQSSFAAHEAPLRGTRRIEGGITVIDAFPTDEGCRRYLETGSCHSDF
jgi:hypothetical protein